MIHVAVPVKIASLANLREHWRSALHRKATHRAWTRYALMQTGPCRLVPPLVITLTRIGPRILDDDNNVGAHKHVRDGVADWLGIDDGDTRLTWVYRQRKGAPRQYGCEIEIAAKAGPV